MIHCNHSPNITHRLSVTLIQKTGYKLVKEANKRKTHHWNKKWIWFKLHYAVTVFRSKDVENHIKYGYGLSILSRPQKTPHLRVPQKSKTIVLGGLSTWWINLFPPALCSKVKLHKSFFQWHNSFSSIPLKLIFVL